jgi:hypothetical protein
LEDTVKEREESRQVRKLTISGHEPNLALGIFQFMLSIFIHPFLNQINACRFLRLTPTDYMRGDIKLSTAAPCRLLFSHEEMTIQSPRRLLLPSETHLGKPVHQPVRART